MDMQTPVVDSVADFIALLGGRVSASAALKQALHNIDAWLHRGHVPAEYYEVHRRVCADHGCPSPNPRIWRQAVTLAPKKKARARKR